MPDLKTLLPAGVLLAAMLGACASPPARFYALSGSVAPLEEAAASRSGIAVAVGPVSLPALVDRPQIVVSTSANQVQFDEFNRWAAPLGEDIARVIAKNLAQALPAARVWPYAQGTRSTPDYQVRIDIQQFVSTLGDGVLIEALWSVRRVAGGAPENGRSLVREATAGKDVEALVAAHSRALAQVSRDIALALKSP